MKTVEERRSGADGCRKEPDIEKQVDFLCKIIYGKIIYRLLYGNSSLLFYGNRRKYPTVGMSTVYFKIVDHGYSARRDREWIVDANGLCVAVVVQSFERLPPEVFRSSLCSDQVNAEKSRKDQEIFRKFFTLLFFSMSRCERKKNVRESTSEPPEDQVVLSRSVIGASSPSIVPGGQFHLDN